MHVCALAKAERTMVEVSSRDVVVVVVAFLKTLKFSAILCFVFFLSPQQLLFLFANMEEFLKSLSSRMILSLNIRQEGGK